MSAKVKVKEVAYFFHSVADIARAKKFYGEFLGLKVLLEAEIQPGYWWIEYDVAGTALGIGNFAPPEPGGVMLALEVEDVDEALAAAKASGYTVKSDLQDYPPCRMFTVSSPDGHAVTLHKRKS